MKLNRTQFDFLFNASRLNVNHSIKSFTEFISKEISLMLSIRANSNDCVISI